MKNTFYYLAIFLGLALTSCEPMEDIHDEINARLDNELAVGNVDLTLTEDDYDELGLNFNNFGSLDEAKTLLPAYLKSLYPNYGPESTANVTFDVFAPLPTERSLIVYEVTTEDYDANEETERFDNFDDVDQIFDFLEEKYTDLENRTLVSLTYKFFDGRVNTLNDGFLFVDGEFTFIPGLTDDEYNLLGERFSNFSDEDEADEKLPLILKEKFKFEILKAGDIKPIMYKLFVTDVQDVDGDGRVDDRTTYSFVKYFIYNGSSFEPYTNTITQTLQFGNIGGEFIPDNTIRYSFTGADYAAVSTAFADIYPGPAENVGRFQSFDVRASSGNYWNPSMLLEAINVALDNLMPSAEEGQQYVVTYAVFNGSVVNETLSVIKEDGVWVLNQ